jgi:phosphatidylserine/phosphatidylglycerophosphate/cardiolipin synthase-like enzyme
VTKQQNQPTRTTQRRQTPGWVSTLQIVGAFLAAVILAIAGLLAGTLGIDTSGNTPVATDVIFQPLPTQVVNVPGRGVTRFTLPQAFGAERGFWRVLFSAPTGSSNRALYQGGIDTELVRSIDAAQRTIDIAAYEFNLLSVTQALLNAAARGVVVRVVTDDEAGFDDRDTTLRQLVDARIPVVIDGRRALMHNKFIIFDSTTVWTGSWNFTVNDTYRNNNNVIILRSRAVVENYQAEFNEMFDQRLFGPNSPSQTPRPDIRQDGVPIKTLFAPEDDVLANIIDEVNRAQSSIRFMVFSFTVDPIGQAMVDRWRAGALVRGIFEVTGSETRFSELPMMLCAGMEVRQDGNPFRLHHKVIIIDDQTVITGSFNISQNAVESNDENLLIITDRDLAAEFVAEFERRWAESRLPQGVTCP